VANPAIRQVPAPTQAHRRAITVARRAIFRGTALKRQHLRCATSATSLDTFRVIVPTVLLVEVAVTLHQVEEALGAVVAVVARSATDVARSATLRVPAPRRQVEGEEVVDAVATVGVEEEVGAMVVLRLATRVVGLGICQGTAFKAASATIATEWDICQRTAHSRKRRLATTVAKKATYRVTALVLLKHEHRFHLSFPKRQSCNNVSHPANCSSVLIVTSLLHTLHIAF